MLCIGTWADNAETNRARIAKDFIIDRLVKHCNANSIAIGVGVTAQVNQALNLGITTTTQETCSTATVPGG